MKGTTDELAKLLIVENALLYIRTRASYYDVDDKHLEKLAKPGVTAVANAAYVQIKCREALKQIQELKATW